MRVVVTGATGTLGSAVMRALAADARVTAILGIARRVPAATDARTRWAAADVAEADLAPRLAGADAVVHLAWTVRPARDPEAQRAVNVDGTLRVAEAVVEAGVPALVVASSLGAYSPGPPDRPVDEDWPRDGIPGSDYSDQKAAVERDLDHLHETAPGLRLVRMRPALVFGRETARDVLRTFGGPLVPRRAVMPLVSRLMPSLRGLRLQAVHVDDAADAFVAAALGSAEGAFNLAADPVMDSAGIAGMLGARTVPVPAGVVRGLMDGAFRLHLQPTPPEWLDVAMRAPLLDASRAREVLGWTPRRTGLEALRDLLDGIADGPSGPRGA